MVIAAFDAATTGRLAVTYYNELLASDFLERLHFWEDTCSWENCPYGIQSPSLYQLVSWAFGTPRNGKVEVDDRILAQQMQRLVACRVDKAPFPPDMDLALAEKASRLLLYEGENRQKLLFTACAAIRKYHYDHFKEEWDMALDNYEHLLSQPLKRADIKAEASRILEQLRVEREPNSPSGTHFMVQVSPDFLARANTKDHDRLMAMLPFLWIRFVTN